MQAELARLVVEEEWLAALRGDGPGEADESFFNLGGTSMAAVTMIARIDKRLGTRPDVAKFFANPTRATLLTSLVSAP